MIRPIAISLSPNTEDDDVFLAIKVLFSPRRWFDDKEVESLENEMAQRFGDKFKAIAVNSGRSAEYLILKALGIGRGDEVAIQAFTCVAVPNSIAWLGAKPLYIDIDETLNMDPIDLEKKISSKTKTVIIQHTFGFPARIDEIRKITKEKGLTLIEDCAHAFGASYKGKIVGTLSDVAFFSFGRDKIISSVFGGAIVCTNQEIVKRVKKEIYLLKRPDLAWILQQLFHPVAMSIILPTYNIGLGKALLFFFQKLGLLSKAVYREEKEGIKPKYFPKKFPGGLAAVARQQLKKLDKYNLHRRKIAKIYWRLLQKSPFKLLRFDKGSVWLRFPVLTKNAPELLNYAKKNGILLGDWYKSPITPVMDLARVGYGPGTCPKAEKVCKEIINLPTYPTLKISDAKRVIENLIEWQNS